MFDVMRQSGGARALLLADEESGLCAILAIDSLVLGPAAGGIRTHSYATYQEGLADAIRLARAMTLKCAIAGLDAGGAKTVVFDHPGLCRPKAFRRLGRFIEELNGLYRAAGDLGTTSEDLKAAAQMTRYINLDVEALGRATALGVRHCMEACAELEGRDSLKGLRIAVQGCGVMGAAVARALAACGASLIVSDKDGARMHALAGELACEQADPEAILGAEADIIAPCASGGVLTHESVTAMKAWAICGAANNQLAEPGVEAIIAAKDIHYVPDFLASAGAVIEGMSASPAEGARLLQGLRTRAARILGAARASGVLASEVAAAEARARIDHALA